MSDAFADERAREMAVAAAEVALSRARVHLDACVRCGLCAESCHVYLADRSPDNVPAAKAETVARLHRRRTLAGRLAPWLVGAEDLGFEQLERIREAVFGRCTACGRCALHCAIGVDVQAIVRAGRTILSAAGRTPVELLRTIETQLTTGNQMAVTPEELKATLEWLSEELARDSGDSSARIPLDEPGRRVLYFLNPREVKFFPLSLQAAAGVFHAAGESWTISSRSFDLTNWGLFAADDRTAAEFARRAVDEAVRLGAEELVLAECGHGFRALRWEAPEWLGAAPLLRVRSVLEVMDEYLAAGRIQVDPARNPQRVTLHDPCNLVRWGGVIEPQRRVLRRAGLEFVEMTPNRENNFCCGGGGGLLAIEEFGRRRIESGKVKADQIRATGAKIVASPCHNCSDQLIEISRVYQLDVEIKSVAEIVYDALVWPSAITRTVARD